MSRTLYVSDLDGTLLNSGAYLSGKTIEIINGLINEGMFFTYATARSFNTSGLKTAELNLRLPVITNNGTFLYEPASGKPVFARMLDKTVISRIRQIVKNGLGCPLIYALFDGVEQVSWLKGTETWGVRDYLNDRTGDERFRPVTELKRLFEGDVFGCTFIDGFEEMSNLQKRFDGIDGCITLLQLDVYHANEYWLEVLNSETSKADAALKVKELAGCDRIVCFGDNLNDIPLFKISDECCAVSNALDSLIYIADEVIGSNDNDGVALWLLDRKNKGML